MKNKALFCLCPLFIILLGCDKPKKEIAITEHVDLSGSVFHKNACEPEARMPFGGICFKPVTSDCNLQQDTTTPDIPKQLFAFELFMPEAQSDGLTLRFLPVTTKPDTVINPTVYLKENISSFKHSNEISHPGYYSVALDNGIKTELAVTPRCGMQYYQYPQGSRYALFLDLASSIKSDSIVKTVLWQNSDRQLEGSCKIIKNGCIKKMYFAIECSQDFRIQVGKNQFIPLKKQKKYTSDGGYVWFDFGNNTNKILVKSSISSANIEGAYANIGKEMSHWSLDKVIRDARQTWKKELQKIKIEGANQEQLRHFYTTLYRAYCYPSLLSDVNGNYLGKDGEVHSTDKYNHYTVNDQWMVPTDISPLFVLTQQKRIRDILRSVQKNIQHSPSTYTGVQPNNTEKIDTVTDYILSSIGLSYISGHKNHYQLKAPLFNRIIIKTGPEKRITITTEKTTANADYLESAWLNKHKLERSWLTHEEIVQGGQLRLILIDK